MCPVQRRLLCPPSDDITHIGRNINIYNIRYVFIVDLGICAFFIISKLISLNAIINQNLIYIFQLVFVKL